MSSIVLESELVGVCSSDSSIAGTLLSDRIEMMPVS